MWRTAIRRRRTRYPARPRRARGRRPGRNAWRRPHAPPPSSWQRRFPCPAHTRPAPDDPTRAGARCTRAGCCASIGNTWPSIVPARRRCAPAPPRRWRVRPAWRRSHTTGRSARARSPPPIDRRGEWSTDAARSFRLGGQPPDPRLPSCAPLRGRGRDRRSAHWRRGARQHRRY